MSFRVKLLGVSRYMYCPLTRFPVAALAVASTRDIITVVTVGRDRGRRRRRSIFSGVTDLVVVADMFLLGLCRFFTQTLGKRTF